MGLAVSGTPVNARNQLEVGVRASLNRVRCLRSWRNWQTRMLEVHVPVRVWRFKSSRPHQPIRRLVLFCPETYGAGGSARWLHQVVQLPTQLKAGSIPVGATMFSYTYAFPNHTL